MPPPPNSPCSPPHDLSINMDIDAVYTVECDEHVQLKYFSARSCLISGGTGTFEITADDCAEVVAEGTSQVTLDGQAGDIFYLRMEPAGVCKFSVWGQ